MCDQTEVSYLDEDVVWVKIGPIWWPGVVKDLDKNEEGKEILAGLKKKPIAVVKFFQEENYEFVKNLDCIYHYNCRRKDEFIRKGLGKFRSGAPHMKKFPSDVTTAESLTKGDINIINDPKFVPEKKESYSEIFGSGKKKNKKDNELSSWSRRRTSIDVTPFRPITHQRFINKVLHGQSDHKTKTLIQSSATAEDNTPENPYKCHICKFASSRVNVIVAHHRLYHSSKNSVNWTDSDSKLIRKKPIYKSRKIKSKKLFDTSNDEFTEEEISDNKKPFKSKNVKDKIKTPEKIKSSTSPSKRKIKDDSTTETLHSKKPRFTDVLLADWNEEEEDDKKDTESDDKSLQNSELNIEKSDDIKGTKNENASPSDSAELGDTLMLEKNQTEKMSCFDFDEEEEGFIGMSNANTYGRKIPRVIPLKDKTELGVDLEIEELFKKKNESELNTTNTVDEENKNERDDDDPDFVVDDKKKNENEENPVNVGIMKRRKSKTKHEKEETKTVNPEDSLALRRARRPGAKKSYLNEVIEKIDDESNKNDVDEKLEKDEKDENTVVVKIDTVKVETSSSSRRKQDFKIQTIDSEKEEMIYSDITNNDQKIKIVSGTEKKKEKLSNSRQGNSDNISDQIDSLLEETKLPNLPTISDASTKSVEKSEEKNSDSTNLSFDYAQNEPGAKKNIKSRNEVKSISRMFSESIPNSELNVQDDSQSDIQMDSALEETKNTLSFEPIKNKTVQIGNIKLSQSGNFVSKKGSIVLSTLPKTTESSVKVMPVLRQTSTSKDCIVLPHGKKLEVKDDDQSSDLERSQRLKNIKTLKVKPDSIPQSLLTTGKLKGQTIIHQKSGKYVIVTQPPQSGRPRITPGKVQPGSKVVILTNQLGEQKIITTSGLQQSKFKVDGQKIISASDSTLDKDAISSASVATTQSQAQSIIKMVPDGKGGIMKQLTMSPKKVLLGGTKVLVSGSGSTFSSSNVQKIALSSGGGGNRSGDFRLIENYKGSGKTVLIQGGSSSGSGVVLKSSSVLPRQVTKVIQNPQGLPGLKKKPKILMRASSSQGDCVLQSASNTIEAPTYVLKQKGADGKFSTPKIVRTEIVNQAKVTPTTKKFFLSGQGSSKKGESYIITTNEVPSKVIRMCQKVKEVEPTQKIVQKSSEVYTIAPNSVLLPSQDSSETDGAQIVQFQEHSEQPVLQTQVIAMPGPVGADGNQTYMLVSVDENGVVQGMDNSVVAYDSSGQQEPLFVNPTSTSNVILLNPQRNEDVPQVYSTSSQDILAEALANTNVLEGTMNNEMDSVVPSILLPPSIPSSVVQETSITLQKPIMTPLEMPSSVAPDTSGLEPPPLPPTPTDEDVLMEETEISAASGATQEQLIQNNKKGTDLGSEDTIQAYMQSEDLQEVNDNSESTFSKELENSKILGDQFETEEKSNGNKTDKKENEFYETDRQQGVESGEFKNLSKEDYIIENSQEEQNTNNFQSMPLLNDEPDTSDDAQGSEPIGDTQFESEKLSSVGRDQEPPSSTNNEVNNSKNPVSDFEQRNSDIYNTEGFESEIKNKQPEDKFLESQTNLIGEEKDNQSMPIIADESNNAINYDVDPSYTDVVSQKSFQEETEVTSTTDEYASKGIGN